ncbi:hypothetical protein D3C76_1456680 [compost metagenome]
MVLPKVQSPMLMRSLAPYSSSDAAVDTANSNCAGRRYPLVWASSTRSILGSDSCSNSLDFQVPVFAVALQWIREIRSPYT